MQSSLRRIVHPDRRETETRVTDRREIEIRVDALEETRATEIRVTDRREIETRADALEETRATEIRATDRREIETRADVLEEARVTETRMTEVRADTEMNTARDRIRKIREFRHRHWRDRNLSVQRAKVRMSIRRKTTAVTMTIE